MNKLRPTITLVDRVQAKKKSQKNSKIMNNNPLPI